MRDRWIIFVADPALQNLRLISMPCAYFSGREFVTASEIWKTAHSAFNEDGRRSSVLRRPSLPFKTLIVAAYRIEGRNGTICLTSLGARCKNSALKSRSDAKNAIHNDFNPLEAAC